MNDIIFSIKCPASGFHEHRNKCGGITNHNGLGIVDIVSELVAINQKLFLIEYAIEYRGTDPKALLKAAQDISAVREKINLILGPGNEVP